MWGCEKPQDLALGMEKCSVRSPGNQEASPWVPGLLGSQAWTPQSLLDAAAVEELRTGLGAHGVGSGPGPKGKEWGEELRLGLTG